MSNAGEGAMRRAGQAAGAMLPGAWQAALVTAASALLFGLWARSEALPTGPAAPATVSRLAEVGPADLEAALGTLEGSREQLARFRQREGCARRLAWVTIALDPGQAPSRVRLQSGTYVSPAFELAATPVRVAMPYPAPYPTGRGTLLLHGTTTGATVALTPPWHVTAQPGFMAREVSWVPTAECPAART